MKKKIIKYGIRVIAVIICFAVIVTVVKSVQNKSQQFGTKDTVKYTEGLEELSLSDGAVLENAAIYSHANYLANGDLTDRTTSEPVAVANGNVTVKGTVAILGDDGGSDIGQTALRVNGTLTLADKDTTLVAYGGSGKTLLYREGGVAIDLDNATIDGNGKVTGVGTGTTNITVTTSNGKEAECKVTVVRQTPSVNYSTHVQDIGWQGYVKDGSTAGTTGQSKRLEAIRIKLSNNTSYNGTIQYQTHVQDIGWQGWKMNDDTSGTSGQSKRLEAIRIKLTDELAENYDIYYRVHAQEFGWLGWAKNGERAGTEGYSYRLEAIQIQLVKKGSSAPGSTSNCFYKR